MREHFHLLLVMSTVGMPCLTQLDVLHHLALLSACCVLVISHRFYVLNVIFKCYLYARATVSACCVLVISHRFYVLNVIFKCYLYARATVSAC